MTPALCPNENLGAESSRSGTTVGTSGGAEGQTRALTPGGVAQGLTRARSSARRAGSGATGSVYQSGVFAILAAHLVQAPLFVLVQRQRHVGRWAAKSEVTDVAFVIIDIGAGESINACQTARFFDSVVQLWFEVHLLTLGWGARSRVGAAMGRRKRVGWRGASAADSFQGQDESSCEGGFLRALMISSALRLCPSSSRCDPFVGSSLRREPAQNCSSWDRSLT